MRSASLRIRRGDDKTTESEVVKVLTESKVNDVPKINKKEHTVNYRMDFRKTPWSALVYQKEIFLLM